MSIIRAAILAAAVCTVQPAHAAYLCGDRDMLIEITKKLAMTPVGGGISDGTDDTMLPEDHAIELWVNPVNRHWLAATTQAPGLTCVQMIGRGWSPLMSHYLTSVYRRYQTMPGPGEPLQ